MNSMNYPKSLLEVWEWKEKLYEKVKLLSDEEKDKFYEEDTREMLNRLGLKKYSEVSSTRLL